MKFTAIFALALLGSVEAFVPQSVHTVTPSVETSSTALPASPPDTATKDIPYGETSRQFRRTVYTHDDWVKHRSPNRFVKNIFSLVNSGIYKVRRILRSTCFKKSQIFLGDFEEVLMVVVSRFLSLTVRILLLFPFSVFHCSITECLP